MTYWKTLERIKLGTLPANNYLFKLNDRITRKKGEARSKLTTKSPKRRQQHRSGVFIVKMQNICNMIG